MVIDGAACTRVGLVVVDDWLRKSSRRGRRETGERKILLLSAHVIQMLSRHPRTAVQNPESIVIVTFSDAIPIIGQI